MNTLFRALSIFSLLALSPFQVAIAEDAATIKGQMDRVYASYAELSKYVADEEEFLSEKNEEKIHSLLVDLRKNFYGNVLHVVKKDGTSVKKDVGYSSTLTAVQRVLDDVQFRFDSGRKRYALWRVRSLQGYCISCHSRFEVPSGFTAGAEPSATLTSLEKGDFYFATRQFDKAAKQFLTAAKAPDGGADRLIALRKWLLIYTRVQPDPDRALRQLNKLRAEIEFAPYEQEELMGWLVSLRRWKNKDAKSVEPIRKAENLINQGLQMDGAIADGSGTVELLRATAILHSLLEEGKLTKKQSGHATYLLGKTYSSLPPILAHELPDMFLEECIREYPGTKDAKRCYKLIYKNTLVEFSGSAGTRIPDEVQIHLRELYKLANDIPQPPSRI